LRGDYRHGGTDHGHWFVKPAPLGTLTENVDKHILSEWENMSYRHMLITYSSSLDLGMISITALARRHERHHRRICLPSLLRSSFLGPSTHQKSREIHTMVVLRWLAWLPASPTICPEHRPRAKACDPCSWRPRAALGKRLVLLNELAVRLFDSRRPACNGR
jgi:hypothetical protein